jgi:two-component system, sensor histidine kinase and response regulator
VRGDGDEALEKLRYAQFDVFLTDLMMPQMDGVTLTQKVRDEFKITPLILMMTAVVDDESRKQTLQAGADEFLIKPYDSADLVQVLSDGFVRCTQLESEVSVIKPL